MAIFWKLGERVVAFEPVDLGLGPTLPHTAVWHWLIHSPPWPRCLHVPVEVFPGTQCLCGRISGHLGRAAINRGLDTHSIQTGAAVPLLALHAGVMGQIPFKERLAPLEKRFQNHQIGLILRRLAIPTCQRSVMPKKE